MKGFFEKRDWIAIGSLLGIVAIYFLPVLTKGNSRVLSAGGTDTWIQYFYWRYFGFDILSGGEVPLWNPYIFSGTPYVAGLQSSLFYPPNLIYLLFQTPFAINLSIAIHCYLASVFTYLFARYIGIFIEGSFLAALVFTYSAPYIFHIYPGHLSNLSTMVWLPLLFMGIEVFLREKKIGYALLTGITFSMQILAGHPQYVFYSLIAVSLYFFFSLFFVEGHDFSKLKMMAGFLIFLCSGILVSAVQLLPAIELAEHSVRENLSYEWVSSFSLPPEQVITLIFPDFFGDMLKVPYWGKNYCLWEMSIYTGIVSISLAAVAVFYERNRYVVIFSAIALISLILAFGRHTPLLKVLYTYVPGFDIFRGLSKFAFIFSFAVSILAGYGFKCLIEMIEEGRDTLKYLSAVFFAVSLSMALLSIAGWNYGKGLWKSTIMSYLAEDNRNLSFPYLNNAFFDASLKAVIWDAINAVAILGLMGGLLLAAWLKRSSKKTVVTVMLAMAAIDISSFGARYLPLFDPNTLYMDKELKAFLKSDRELFRVATPSFSLSNVGMMEGIENIGGYDAAVSKRYSEFINITQGFPIDRPSIDIQIHRMSPLLDILNTKYFILESTMNNIDISGLDLAFENARYKVYRNQNALPRAFVVHNTKVVRGKDNIFRHLESPEFNPTAYAIVEDEPPTWFVNDPTLKSPLPRLIKYTPNSVKIEAVLNKSGLLILGDAYYPGWIAYVDEKETKVYPINYVTRGLYLQGGRHMIEFRYEPLPFRKGAFISLISLFFIIGFLILMQRPTLLRR